MLTAALVVVLLLGLAVFGVVAEQSLPPAPPPPVELTEQGAPWREVAEPLPADHRHAGRHIWRPRHESRGVRHA